MPTKRRSLLQAAPLPMLLLLAAPVTPVDAASALGRANATVIAPAIISPVNISIAMPSIVARTSSTSRSATAGTVSTASVSADLGTELARIVTVAGISVESLDGGTSLSFSIAGDTTSAYVVQLTPAGNAGSPEGAQGAGAANGQPASGNAPGLILATQPLSGSGRLSVVLSQGPSELLAGAISLSVNYN